MIQQDDVPPAAKKPQKPSGCQEGGEKQVGEDDDDWSESEAEKLCKRSKQLDEALKGDNSACSGDMSDEDLMWGTGGAYGSDYESNEEDDW